MELQDQDVVGYLASSKTVRDGHLTAFSVRSVEMNPEVEMTFEMYLEQPVRIVRLTLRGIKEFGFNHDHTHSFYYVESIKCLWTPEGEFFLSLDPYDEQEPLPSGGDNNYFRSASVRMSVEHRST